MYLYFFVLCVYVCMCLCLLIYGVVSLLLVYIVLALFIHFTMNTALVMSFQNCCWEFSKFSKIGSTVK